MHVAIGLFPVFTTYLSLHNALYSVIVTMQAWIIDYDACMVSIAEPDSFVCHGYTYAMYVLAIDHVFTHLSNHFHV